MVVVIVSYLLQVTWSDKMYLYNTTMWKDDRNDQMQLCNEQHGWTLCLNTAAAGEGTSSSSTPGTSGTQARYTQPASGEWVYLIVFIQATSIACFLKVIQIHDHFHIIIKHCLSGILYAWIQVKVKGHQALRASVKHRRLRPGTRSLKQVSPLHN